MDIADTDDVARRQALEGLLREAVGCHRAGELDEAERLYRSILSQEPGHPDANHNLGVLLVATGHAAVALPYFQAAIQASPSKGQFWLSCIDALILAGQLDAAGKMLGLMLDSGVGNSDAVGACFNLAAAFMQQGRYVDAEGSCRRAIELNPGLAVARSNLAMVLIQQGRYVEAEASCRRAIELDPELALAHNNLAMALNQQDRSTESAASCRRSIELDPGLAEAHNNLADVLRKQDRPGESEASCRRALELKPELADAHSNLGAALLDQGRLAEAADSYRRALDIRPNRAATHQDLLFCLSHGGGIEPEALFAEHVRFAERFEAPLRAGWPRHGNSREPERQLRVGYVSGDFREHATVYFVEPVLSQLAHLASHPAAVAGLSLHAYYNNAVEDAVTQRLRGHFSHWNQVQTLSDEQLAAKIQSDGIDILVDLTGHTARSRLLAFARKPAPVQCGWIGYLGSSGLKSMDYYLADRYFLPPGEFDRFFTEKIVYLPAVVAYRPSVDAPEVNPLPALAGGRFTFGSFSRISKLSREVVALWSQLLRALPESQMLIGAMPRDGRYQVVSGWFEAEGIGAERLLFHERCDQKTYMATHHRVDLCLDPFPFTGSTTTAHALWMGVPTLTLTGQTVAGRLGPALLQQAGLEDFVAHSPREFVDKGIYWAGNLESLALIRAGMRERVLLSPIGQPGFVAKGLAVSFREMWRDWCANGPELPD